MDETRRPSVFVSKGLKRVLQTTGRRKRARYCVQGTTQRDENLQGREESLDPINQRDAQSEWKNTDRKWSSPINKIKEVLSEINAFVEQTLLQRPWAALEPRGVPISHASTILGHIDGPSKDQQEAGHTKQGALCTSRNPSACARCHGCKSSMLDIEDSLDHVRHHSATPSGPTLRVPDEQRRKTVQWAKGTKSGDDETMTDPVPVRVRLRKKSRRVSTRKSNNADE